MIREIEVGNFQSLRKVKVQLGKFTVVTGPTGIGKSAFIRAVRALAFNVRGTSAVSRGEKTLMVSACGDEIEHTGMDDDFWRATLHRGGRDSYALEVALPPSQDAGGDFSQVKTFTKLAGKVPDQVTAQLRLTDLNFAGQFDRPYLLDATGSEVARVLGKLTNVTLLYKAAQEANRRRMSSAAQLKTRQSDLAALEQQIAGYVTLQAEKTAVEVAEAAIVKVLAYERKLARLDLMFAAMQQAWQVHGNLSGRVFPEPPSLDRLQELASRVQRLRACTGAVDDATLTLRAREPVVTQTRNAEEQAQRELAAYTDQWDVCPTCGQPVRKEHGHQEGST